MRSTGIFRIGVASALCAVILSVQACGQLRNLSSLNSLTTAGAALPDAVQTPPIGPTPPPTGNYMLEYPVPTSFAQPRGIHHCGFNLCVTEYAASKIAILTTTGVFREYNTPTSGAGPSGVADGPDSDYWFTEALANKIGKLTDGGRITEYPIPTPASGPSAIWSSKLTPRQMWFTESGANQIATIDADTGAISEFPIPTPNSDPDAITQAHDGSVWFVEHKTNKVGTITPAGVITEYKIPTRNSGADDITFVEDGNVWITEPLVGKIARVGVPGGHMTEYTVPFAGSMPSGIGEGDTVNHGYDGNHEPKGYKDDQVWFTDAGLNAVSGYNYYTKTFVTPIAVPTLNAGVGSISYGLDNNMWFVEQDADKVGVYHLPTPAPSTSPRA